MPGFKTGALDHSATPPNSVMLLAGSIAQENTRITTPSREAIVCVDFGTGNTVIEKGIAIVLK